MIKNDEETPDAAEMNRCAKEKVKIKADKAIKLITADIVRLAEQGQFYWYDKNRLLETCPEVKAHFKSKGYKIIVPPPFVDDVTPPMMRISWR